ncbi:MAG: DcaP family trimeric outer membrane transporter [Burkholderiales bacterium]
MTSQPTVIALAVLLGFAAVPARAQTMDEMRVELKQLRAEVEALKGRNAVAVAVAPPASAGAAGPVAAPAVAAAAPTPQSVIPGGLLIPGTVTSLHLYGNAETHAIHDFRQSSSPDVFTDLTYQPLSGAGGQKGKTQFTAETSRLGFETSTPAANGSLTTKVEVDFYAYGADGRNRLRLRHAYGEYDGWLIGQTWSTFMDVDDLPETVDFNGPIGAPFSRRAMVRYAFGDPKAGVRVTLAAEDPADLSGGPSSGEKLPQLVARLDKSFDWGAVNLRAMTHSKRSESETKRGYGFGVGGSYKLGSKDTLMGQYTRVDGDVDALYGSNGYAIDSTTGAISFDRNQGLVLGYAHVFSDRLRSNVVMGLNRGQTALGAGDRTLKEVFLNLIYSPIKNVDLGGEWIWGQRKTFDGEIGGLSRIDLMARYSF